MDSPRRSWERARGFHMRFSSAFLDEVRERIPLSVIVGRYVQWDKKKTNHTRRDYWGCCPFHGEKSPSFHVDDKRGIYHCFGCGVHGDHFRFLMEKAGRSFPEAVEEVARDAGVTLPVQTPEVQARDAKRLTLLEANEKAARWFQAQLQQSGEAKAYLARRGISAEEAQRFRLGYAPDGNGLLKATLGQQADMVEAGLLGQKDGRAFDWFRNRLMFPILDKKGHAIAFSARAMADGQEPKYLNSPETPIFDKGATFYNGAAAREAAWAGATLVVVEGNIDAIAATRTGVAAAAPMGTAFTAQHVTQLQRMSHEAVFCFDGDAAGRKAANRTIDLVLPVVSPQFTAKFAHLPDGQDPDSMIRRSPGVFTTLVKGASTLADALWRRETAGIVPGVPEQKAKLEAALRTALGLIQDRPTRRAYGADFQDRLRTLGERPKVYRSNSWSQHSTSPSANRLAHGSHGQGMPLREAILIGAIASAPLAAMDVAETLSADARLSPEAVDLIGRLVMAISEGGAIALSEVLAVSGLTEVVEEAIAKANAAGVPMELGTEAPMALDVLKATAH